MKPVLRFLLAGAALGVGCGASAAVNPSLVASDARWVLHADLNALRQSSLGKEFIAMAEKSRIDVGGPKVGLDVPKVLATIGMITAYGSNFSPDPKTVDGALVIQGTPDLRKIVESVLLQAMIASPETVSEVTGLGYSTYRVAPKKHGAEEPVGLLIAFPPEPILLLSKSRVHLEKARDVFRGNAPSVAKTPGAPLHGLLQSGTSAFLFGASVVPPSGFGELTAKDGPPARILRMTHSGTVALGEERGNSYAHARLIATSDEMADKLMKIVQGMAAMLSLTDSSDKNLAEFLNATKVERDDKVVRVDISHPSDRLVTMVRSLHESSIQRRNEALAAGRAAQLADGQVIAEWKAEAAEPTSDGTPASVTTKVYTIPNVTLRPGSVISLGRMLNGGRGARFDHIEIVPVASGAPLTFKTEYMMRGGPRGALWLQQFPGAEGEYRIKVTYRNDPDGKASYAVSVRHPKPPASESPKADAPKS